MARRLTTLDEAKKLARAYKDGQLSPEQMQAAEATLRQFKADKQARDEFVQTKVDTTPTDTGIIDHLAPKTSSGSFGIPFTNITLAGEDDPEKIEASRREAQAKWESEAGYDKYRAAAGRGVDITSGINPAIRGKAATLNFKPGLGAAALAELARQEYGDELPYGLDVVGNIEGVPVMLQPQEDGTWKYHAIDGVSMELADLTAWGAELPPIALETAGSVAGAAIGGAAGTAVAPGAGTVAGATAGSVIGSGIAGYLSLDARVAMAQAFGVPEEMLDEAVTNPDRFLSAAMAAGGDLAAAAGIGVVRGLSNRMGARSLTREQFLESHDTIVDSLKKAAELEDASGKPLNLTLGQLTGREDLLVSEKIIANQARLGTAADLAEDYIRQDRAAQEALRSITEQRVRTPRDNIRSIEEVTEDVRTGLGRKGNDARRAAEEAQDELDEFQTIADEQMTPDQYIKVRDQAHAEAGRLQKAETKAWNQWRKEVQWKQGEGSNILVQNNAVRDLMLEMDEDAQRALLESTRNSQQRFLEDAGLPTGDEGGTIRPNSLASEWVDPREMHFTMSDLKRRIRQAERSDDPDGFRVTDMKRMVKAMEDTMRKGEMRYRRAGRGVPADKAARVREAFDVANELTLKGHTLFDSANMRTLLDRNPRTGKLTMPAGMIRDRVFAPNDPRFLDEALEAVGHNPQTKAALAEELVKKHRNRTRRDADGSAHRDFIDQHYDHIRALGIDPDNLRGARALSEAVDAATKKAKRVGDELARTFGKRLTDGTTDALDIHEELLKVGPSKARNVMATLEREFPDLANEVRDHSLTTLRREMASKGDTVINFDALWKHVDKHRATLRELHGTDYVASLDMLKRATQVISRGGLARSVPGQNVQPTLIELTRSLWGPLSKKQRFLSALQRTNRRWAGRSARKVITSPEDVVQLIKHRNRTATDVMRDQVLNDAFWEALYFGDDSEAVEESIRRHNGEIVRPDRANAMQQIEDRIQRATAPRAALGSSVVPGRESPAEAVGAERSRGGAMGVRPGAAQEAGIKQLHRHEGFRPFVYDDATGERVLPGDKVEGKRTIGFGRNLDDEPLTQEELKAMGTTREQVMNGEITEDQAAVLFARDYAKAVTKAVKFPGWSEMNRARKDVIINMIYNMGSVSPSKWENFHKALGRAARAKSERERQEAFSKAADEMLTGSEPGTPSKWSLDVGNRAIELAEQMRTGKHQEELEA